MATFAEVLNAAIADMIEHGYDSEERVARWQEALQQAAEASMRSRSELERMMREALASIYTRLVDRAGVLKHHPGIERFTLERVRPQLRAELDRRIMASADLIRLNRDEMISQTLRRFAGWSTSIPPGGVPGEKRAKTKARIRKSVAGLPFTERRVLIDQGHKLTSAINDILAKDGGALAAVWHSHWRQPGYNYREDHKERDQHVYTLRKNWALERGLMKVGPDGYYEDYPLPGQEPYCRCYASFLYNLRQLPEALITKKGRDELDRVMVA